MQAIGIISVYLLIGAITAAVTVKVFPPIEGFRPKLSVLATAIGVFVLLWPVLALLAVWYHLTGKLQRRKVLHRAPESASEPRLEPALHSHLGQAASLQRMSAKPR